MDAVNWNALSKPEQECIRQVMLKETVRAVKIKLPRESGRTCHAIAWNLVKKALERESEKDSTPCPNS